MALPMGAMAAVASLRLGTARRMERMVVAGLLPGLPSPPHGSHLRFQSLQEAWGHGRPLTQIRPRLVPRSRLPPALQTLPLRLAPGVLG